MKSEAAEFARIRTLLEVLVRDTKEMREKVEQMAALDKHLAELEFRHESHLRDAEMIQNRLHELDSSREAAESFIDKVKGALVLIGFLQAVLVGGCTWLVTQVIDSRQDIAVLQVTVSSKHEHDMGKAISFIPNDGTK